MFINDGHGIVGFSTLKYKGLLFDHWEDEREEGNGIWSRVCEHCFKGKEELSKGNLSGDDSPGACGIRHCYVVGDDTWHSSDGVINVEYIDFDEDEVEIVEEMIPDLILSLQKANVTKETILEELEYRDGAGENRWDDNLYEFTTEELEIIVERWDMYAVANV